MTRLLPLILLVSLAACGGGERTTAAGSAGDTGGNVSYAVEQASNGATTTVRGADGSTATIRTGDAAGAAALPEGFALYPGARVVQNMSVDSSEGDSSAGSIVAFESADPPERIIAFYRSAAQRAGYQVNAEMANGAMTMLGGKRAGDEHGFTLTVNRTGDKSVATMIGGS